MEDDRPQQEQQHEVLLYSPHGIRIDQPALQAFLHNMQPPVRVLGMMHPLKDNFAFGMRMTFGVASGLVLERQARPKYWVKSHNSMLLYSGVIARLVWINDIARTMQSGLEEEEDMSEGANSEKRRPNLVEVENGECSVLE